jgi:hypothetical protein
LRVFFAEARYAEEVLQYKHDGNGISMGLEIRVFPKDPKRTATKSTLLKVRLLERGLEAETDCPAFSIFKH